MEKKDYSPLFTPFRIGSMEVKNRIVLSPMGQKAATPYGAKTECESLLSLTVLKTESFYS